MGGCKFCLADVGMHIALGMLYAWFMGGDLLRYGCINCFEGCVVDPA